MRQLLARGMVKALGPQVFNDLVSGNLLGRNPRLGTREILKAYSWSPWLRAVVNKVAADVAGLTWTVKVATNGSGKAVRARALQSGRQRDRLALAKSMKAAGTLRTLDNHPILDTIHGGNNPFFQGFANIELTQIFLDLVGEAAWLFDRNSFNMPTTTYPIPPTWVAELPTAQRPFYAINGPTGRRDVPTENVLWFYHPDPVNPYARGSGLGMVLGDELETDEAAAKHTKSWFKNRAVPDVLIYGEFGVEEKKAIEQTWINKLRGAAKAWLPFFLNREVKVEKLSQTFENMQLVELRASERDIIVQIFGVPPEVFGILANSNRSTIDVADYLMKRYVTVPRAEYLRQVWQRRLVPLFDEKLIIDYENPVAEDLDFELKVMVASPWAANVNEWRARMGLEPLPGKLGSNHVLTFQNIIVTDLAAEAPAAPAPAPAAPPVATPPAASPAAAAAAFLQRKGKADLTDAEISTVVLAVRPAALTARAQQALEATIAFFGQQVLDELNLGISFNLRDPKVTDFLANWGAEKITGQINETTRQAIRDELVAGVSAGDNMRDLAARIVDVFDEADTTRATLIARTEIGGASNFGAWEALDQAQVEQKQWLSTRDNHVRDTHEALDGQTVGVNELFQSPDGGSALYPGGFGDPAEDCNCRCGVTAVISEAASADVRAARWKTLEADRRPFERKMRGQLRAGFDEQRAAALAALADIAENKARRVA